MSGRAAQIEALSVRAARREVLRVESLTIGRGATVGLLGPNGAGKSTLLRCLLGMQPHVRGRVAVLEREIASLGPGGRAALRRRIGYVPQILPARAEMPLTVREVVAIGRTGLAGLFRPLSREDWWIVDDWIDRLGLGPLSGQSFSEISGGEQRKTLIARAMVHQPELLLLDEPTANLDLGWRERIVELVDELSRSPDLTVLLVCHELEVLPPCCGRALVVDRGEIIADGSPGEVLSPERIAALYGPGLAVLRRGERWAVVPAEQAHA